VEQVSFKSGDGGDIMMNEVDGMKQKIYSNV